MTQQIDLEEFINEQKEKETKMQINAKELLKVLTKLSKGQEQSMIGTGDSFVFNQQGIFVYAGDVAIFTPFTNLGNFTIKGDKLIKFLSKSKDINYEVSLNTDKGVLELKDVNKVAEFAVTEELDLSGIPQVKEEDFTTVGQDFTQALEYVKNTAAKNVSVPSHKVLEYIHINGNIIEATDAVKFCRITLENSVTDKPFLIRADKFTKVKPVGINAVAISGNFVFLRTEEGILYALPTTDSTFLPTEKIIETTESENTIQVEFEPQLEECLDRLIAVAENTYQPKMTLKADGNAVFTLESGSAKIKETIKTDYTGQNVTIKFDARTLKNTLVNNILSISEKEDGKAKVIRCDNGNKTYVLFIKD